jgi:hypothetical protein
MHMTMKKITELEAVSLDMFREEIVPAGKAVVMRGAVNHWASVAKATNTNALCDYLRAGAGSGDVSVMRAKPSVGGRFFYADDIRKFNFDQAKMGFAAFLDELMAGAGGDALYMGSTPIGQGFPGLSQDFPMPLVPAGTEPRLWVGNRTIVSTHHDGSSNIASVVAGTRTFTLFPPEQVRNLYPGPIEHTMAGPQVSLVDLDAPDLDRFPRYADALSAAQTADLGPGDAIYMPPLWWHHVRATGDFNVLVNFWWTDRPQISREPMEAFVLSLLSVRQLPAPEREAWRAMFDYFIFQTDGLPLDHIPDELQGVLGPINPHRAKAIWTFFTDMMR